jgi:hypothetical protein
MPFCVLPKNIADIIMRKRVVINETHVNEFMKQGAENRISMVSQTSKKSNRLSGLMMNSPRSTKSNSKNSTQMSIPQEPILAPASTSNPFYDNRFPVINPLN